MPAQFDANLSSLFFPAEINILNSNRNCLGKSSTKWYLSSCFTSKIDPQPTHPPNQGSNVTLKVPPSFKGKNSKFVLFNIT